jgi:hypothetical protein
MEESGTKNDKIRAEVLAYFAWRRMEDENLPKGELDCFCLHIGVYDDTEIMYAYAVPSVDEGGDGSYGKFFALGPEDIARLPILVDALKNGSRAISEPGPDVSGHYSLDEFCVALNPSKFLESTEARLSETQDGVEFKETENGFEAVHKLGNGYGYLRWLRIYEND